MKTLAIFDFDETLTTKDTLFSGIKAVISDRRYERGMKVVSFFMPHFKKKRISSTVMKNIVSFVFFRGLEKQEVERRSEEFLSNEISRIENRWHYEKFAWHKEENHDIVIVTANFNLWVKQWADERNVPCICTDLAARHGTYTGFIVGKNNYDDEKINRLRAMYDLDKYDDIYAYTDSLTDKCLLDVATKGFLNGEKYCS